MKIFIIANLHFFQFQDGNQMKMSKQCYLCLRQKGDTVTPQVLPNVSLACVKRKQLRHPHN